MREDGKIDSPVDAAFEAWPDKPGDVGEKAKEVALAVGGAFFPPLEVFRILKEQLSIEERFARVEYLFGAVRTQIGMIESESKKDRDRLQALQNERGRRGCVRGNGSGRKSGEDRPIRFDTRTVP